MHQSWYAPLDPDCPEVIKVEEMMDDPITVMGSVGGDIWESFERKHRGDCSRCQMYGAENIEVG